MKKRVVLKVGGAELAAGPQIEALVEVATRTALECALVVVHGGGPEIAALQKRLGIASQYVQGLRVTDEESLWVAQMVLSATVNKRLVARLVMNGVRALGLSGVDAGLLRAVALQHPQGDLGRVGEITQVNADLLSDLMATGLTPVISPISLGDDGRPFNVNADHAALAVAAALHADEAIFLTNVPGVMVDGIVLEKLSGSQVEQLITDGTVTGGMIPKVRSALDALSQGVEAVRITDLQGLTQGTGTLVSAPSA